MGLKIQQSETDFRFIEIYWGEDLFRSVSKSLFIRDLKPLSDCQSEEDFKEKFKVLEDRLAKKEVIRMLAKKSYLSTALFDKLEEKGFSKETIQKVLAFAEAHHFIDDSQEIKRMINREQRKGYGAQAIVFKLKQKKVPSEDFDSLYKEIKGSEQEALEKLLKKKYAKVDWKDNTAKQKAIGQLARRGFSFDMILIGINSLQ